MIVKIYRDILSVNISTCNPLYNYKLLRVYGPSKTVNKCRKNTTEWSVVTDEQIIGYVPLGFV